MPRATIVYGRFNPPTYAHDLLVRFAQKHARETRSSFAIFTTHSQNSKTDPLSYEEKVEVLNLLYGQNSVSVFPQSTIFNIVGFLDSTYDEVDIVMGGDRSKKFEELFKKYADDYDCRVNIIRFAERDKYNISATMMRQWACDGKYQQFIDNCPPLLSINQRLELYRKVATSMIGNVRRPNEPKRFTLTSEDE